MNRKMMIRLNMFLCFFVFLTFSYPYLNTYSACTQDAYGNECVIYVRNYFGGNYALMPALCGINSDCGAYNAWGNWDLGFGSGSTPQDNSIMVINKTSGVPVGHIAVVDSQSRNSDGTYSLSVHESNWHLDHLVDCNVNYTFYPSDSTVSREGSGRYPVLGFIYSSEGGGTDNKPDLKINTLTIEKSGQSPSQSLTLEPNESFEIAVNVKNSGDGDANDKFYIKYLISDDRNFSSSDDGIADDSGDDDDSILSLNAGDTNDENITVRAPSELGTYYIGAWVDYKSDIDEEDEHNNFSDSDDEIGTIVVETPNNKAVGHLDKVSCNTIEGWARDPDTTNPIKVHIYANGPKGTGVNITSITADVYRGDLPFSDKNHGYIFRVPHSLRDNQIHSIYVYAEDSQGGETTLLTNSPKDLKCVPIGAVLATINSFLLTPNDDDSKNPQGGFYGDINGDGLRTLLDAILALKIVAGMTPTINAGAKEMADVNNNKKVDIAEAIYVLRYISGLK